MSREIKMMASTDGSPTELYFYDEGKLSFFDVYSPADLQRSLAALNGEPVSVRIDSAGGNPYHAVTMYTLLTEYSGTVTGIVDGMAASSMSLLACACSHLSMRPGSQFMIHNPTWSMGGTAEDFTSAAQRLTAMQESAAEIYARRSGLSDSKVAEMMSAETWMIAGKTIELGFADEVLAGESVKMEASRFRDFKNSPQMASTIEEGVKVEDERAQQIRNAARGTLTPEAIEKFIRDGTTLEVVQRAVIDKVVLKKQRAKIVAMRDQEKPESKASRFVKPTDRVDPNNPLMVATEVEQPVFQFSKDYQGIQMANRVLNKLGQGSMSGKITPDQQAAIDGKVREFEGQWQTLSMKSVSLQDYVDSAFMTFSTA